MNIYHGFPISGDDIQPVRFLRGNRKALVSFRYPKSLDIVSTLSSSFVLDNGAFSYNNAGKGEIDVDAYLEWVKTVCRYPNFDWCLIPDKINGTEEENKQKVTDWLSICGSIKSVPVYHLHESLEYLDWLCSKFDTVALGSSGEYCIPGNKKWWDRIAKIMNNSCDADGYPKVKFHGLRMLDPDIFTRLPLSSADSTNAGQNAGSIKRFGSYPGCTAGQRAENIADIIEAHNSAQKWTREDQQEFF